MAFWNTNKYNYEWDTYFDMDIGFVVFMCNQHKYSLFEAIKLDTRNTHINKKPKLEERDDIYNLLILNIPKLKEYSKRWIIDYRIENFLWETSYEDCTIICINWENDNIKYGLNIDTKNNYFTPYISSEDKVYYYDFFEEIRRLVSLEL